MGFLHAAGGGDGFAVIPTANALPHGAYQLHGEIAWHRTVDSVGYSNSMPWVTGLRFGLYDQTEFAVDLGQKISIAAKMQFVREGNWLPAVAFGARQIFHSQEAHFYSVPDSLQDSFAQELYLAAAKNIGGHTGLNVGVSYFPDLDSGETNPFWGISQKLFAGIELNYEGFQRSSRLHHNLGLSWTLQKVLRISAGATEVNRFWYQGGDFGFYLHDKERHSGESYASPGFWVGFSLTGFMSSRSYPAIETRVSTLEQKLSAQTRNNETRATRMDHLELQMQELHRGGTDSLSIKEAKAERLLDLLVKGLGDETWDPQQGKHLQDSLLALGEVADRMLIRVVERESSALEFRLVALRLMGSSQNPRFVPSLGDVLKIDEPAIQRECVLALARISSPEAIDLLRSFRTKASADLWSMIDEILGDRPVSTKTPVPLPPLPILPQPSPVLPDTIH
ncbi:MAG TPA: HEAT repeat domain-containing protein [Fibrobacteraceae bacterium]|nr:HEAT repeat domain-containing protein [Fibrobacteraceae bacterium]